MAKIIVPCLLVVGVVLILENEQPVLSPKATSSLWRWGLFISVAVTAFALDHFVKWLVVRNLSLYETWVPLKFLENIFDITYTRNTGAAFGMGQRFSDVFLVLAFVVTGIIAYYYRQIPDGYWLLRMALGMMVGGALGNAIDRVLRGYVVDMFHVHRFPIFNVADSMVVVGVLIWAIILWREDQNLQAQAKQNPPAQPDSPPEL